MKPSRAIVSMVMCLALLALVISPVAPALAQDRVIELTGVSNFRDLGGYTGVSGAIEWEKIFRSGHFASFDNDWQGLGIETVIDLRNDGDKMRDSLYDPESLGAWWINWEIVPDSGIYGTLDPTDPTTWHGHDVFHEDGSLYVSVPFNQGDPTAVGWEPPYADPWQYNNIILWSLVDNWPGPDSSALDYWYVGILEANKPAIKQVFEVLADSNNYPLVFHCTQGKDRVGTVSALLLDLLGVPAQTIIEDYALTQTLTADATAATLAELEGAIYYSENLTEGYEFLYGLMPEGAEASHWEPAICIHMPAIQSLLFYMQFMYGGAEGFLTSIGVDPHDLIKVRANLLADWDIESKPIDVGIGVTESFATGAVSVTFGEITGAGDTSVYMQTGRLGGGLPSGVTPRGLFVDISTTSTYAGAITVALNYDPGTSNPEELRMFHWNGASWNDVTTSVDTGTNTIYGEVDSLSPFFYGHVQTRGVPVFFNIYAGIAAVLAAGLMAYVLRRRFVQQ